MLWSPYTALHPTGTNAARLALAAHPMPASQQGTPQQRPPCNGCCCHCMIKQTSAYSAKPKSGTKIIMLQLISSAPDDPGSPVLTLQGFPTKRLRWAPWPAVSQQLSLEYARRHSNPPRSASPPCTQSHWPWGQPSQCAPPP